MTMLRGQGTADNTTATGARPGGQITAAATTTVIEPARGWVTPDSRPRTPDSGLWAWSAEA